MGFDIAERLAGLGLDGARVVVLVPDGTRSIPLGRLFAEVHDALIGRVRSLDVLIALGTHQPMSRAAIERRFDLSPGGWAARYPGVRVHNHAWHDPSAFADLGTIPADEVKALSGGVLSEPIPVRVNRLVAEADACLVLGPVFPHESVGFSGGDKYFFPGASGPEVIDAFHWLGALIGTMNIIGKPGITPVRAVIHAAASRIPARRLCVAVVVAPNGQDVRGVYVGTTGEAWAAAAEHSARVHIRYVDRPYRRIVSVMPPMYDDIWTAAKGMYKVEPAVADGGEVIVYAPHVSTFSVTHDAMIRRAGYHCRDYLLAHADELAGVPRAVLAHSMHLRGQGSYVSGVERCRIDVRLATAIPPADCAAVNLGWADPATLDLDALAADPDTLVIPKAGEQLYRPPSP
ncbi:lactate racemase domain-containing protein [Actinomycetes bacterium KLBMP 9797]